MRDNLVNYCHGIDKNETAAVLMMCLYLVNWTYYQLVTIASIQSDITK